MTELRFKTPRKTYRRDAAPAVGCIVMVLFAALCVAILVVLAALAVGAANAWIMEGNFTDGWHKAWERWPITLGWSLIAGFLVMNFKGNQD